MKERLQKILSSRGVCSRRSAEAFIAAGRVSCNGTVCKIGDSADPDRDIILVDGEPLPVPDDRVYIMLHKPKGYVTTLSDERGRKNAAQPVAGCGKRVYPVGRLDMDSEGLLLFTNDGAFANELMHPSYEVKKTYLVTVDQFSNASFERLKLPIRIDGYWIKPPELSLICANGGYAQLEITIHEGRNRQVRRMCAFSGMKVRRLVRIREGEISLGDLKSGQWRYLTHQEIQALRK